MRAMLWALAGASMLSSTTAVAQTVPSGATEAQAAGAQTDEPAGTQALPGDIVVTAQKRNERLLDVPQSITAVTAESLDRLGATQFRDFANTVPGLSFTTAGVGQTQISLRGVTAGVDIGPTVGIYVDDVPYGSSSAFSNASSLALDVGLLDLDRVEVLRGPQGTLYGAGAMGGVVKYVTRAPDPTGFGGTGQAGVSFTRRGGTNYNAAAALNAPLVQDKLAVRASGFYNRDGGFVDNVALGQEDVDRSKVYGGRVDALLQPTSEFSVRLTGFGQDIRRRGTPTQDFTLAGRPNSGDLKQRRLQAEPFRQNFRLASGTLGYDFGGATLTSVTSYQTVRSRFRQDASAVYVPLLGSFGLPFGSVALDQRRTTKKFAQEARLASPTSGTIEWLLGGYYTRERSGNGQAFAPFAANGTPSPLNLATVSIPSRFEEIAGFGDVTVRFSQAFDVTGGVRYAHNKQRFEQIGSGLLIGSVPRARASDDVVTYLANARLHLGSRTIAYARFATGYRPGGPNFVVRNPATGALLADPTFKSDSLNSYELGLKGETNDRTLSFDASGYHIDWKDIQIATAAGGVSVIANADNGAKIDGAELTLTARPASSFTAAGAFAYQRARLNGDEPLLGAVKGERLPNVPRLTATVSADWTPGSSDLHPSIGGTLRFVSDRRASFDANPGLPQYRLPSYVTVDLRAGVAVRGVELQAFARNLLDERGQLSAGTILATLGGPAQVTVLQPRTIGVSATTRF